MNFKEITAEELNMNPFTKIGSEWMLITAGTREKFNTMTASWGGVGVFWGKNTATCYIRPQRYTKEFIDSNDSFTISFYKPEYHSALQLCGSVSGRDRDKIAESGLTPFFVDGVPAFEEASLILVCRKLYRAPMKPEDFIAKENDEKFYPNKDYHDLYISEITKILVPEK